MGLQTTAAQTPAQHGPEHSPLGFKQCSVTDECAARGTPTTHAQQARFSRTTGPLLPLAQRHRDSDQRNTQHERPASLQQQRHTVTTLPRKTSYQNQGHFMPNHAINHMEQRRATQALLQKEHARVAARHSVTHMLAAATPLGAGTGAPVGLGVWGRARPTRVSCKRVGLSESAAQAQQLGTHRNKPITVAACGRSLEELRRRAPAWESDRGARSQRARRRGRISS
jgi:hypothetical protein